MKLSQQLYSEGWIPGFPSYDVNTWVGFDVEYFCGVAWHRKQTIGALEQAE